MISSRPQGYYHESAATPLHRIRIRFVYMDRSYGGLRHLRNDVFSYHISPIFFPLLQLHDIYLKVEKSRAFSSVVGTGLRARAAAFGTL
jgi:hypothetical protein